MEKTQAITEEKNRENTKKEKTEETHKAVQHEDVAWKTMMQFFAGEVLPFLGISGKVAGFGPTELVRLEVKKFYEDFTLRMEDGSWKHFEFQSRDRGIADLKRFRAYEAVDSYQNQVEVTTYVLYSGNIKNPITEYYTGINTYRVVPVVLQEWDADNYLKSLREKSETGESLTREDLVLLALSPLMGGESLIRDRIKEALEITNEGIIKNTEDKNRIGAVIYTMADKFLDTMDMEEVKEAMRMTRLGQMLVEDGRREGREDGIRLIVQNMHQKGFTPEEISGIVEQDKETILVWLDEPEQSWS